MNPIIYLEVSFSSVPEGFDEILTAELAEIGFDSFSEEEPLFLAYIPEADFNEMAVHQVVQKYPVLKDIIWSVTRMPYKNWNEVWESSYEPVLIAGRCYIRAPFHPTYPTPNPSPLREGRKPPSGGLGVASVIEIIIEPKMSFGTAHHETTALMIEALLEEELKGQHVLDMGCGTGVLAILAHKLGASTVVAIDNDTWAFENASENVLKNEAVSVHVIKGDVNAIPKELFDLILANINRNTLVEQIPVYSEALQPGGRLILSGFYSEDLPDIEACAARHGLSFSASRKENNWTAAKFNR